MRRGIIFPTILLLFFGQLQSCSANDEPLILGAERTEIYLPLLKGKKVAVVANQTSIIDHTHLVDSLLSLSKNRQFSISCVFAPEHGFRGASDAGESVVDGKDTSTGLMIYSLYGGHKKPSKEQLANVDIVLFDIQDVGVRFYTYISSLHYVMEACADYGKQLIVFDRPNPNGNYVDGPVLNPEFSSFVGMHPIPVVHGLTIGELALMINEEGWLNSSQSGKARNQCNLKVITCENYTHNTEYVLPVKPSPNLPTQHSIRMYPSMCFFEGTVISEGRGTMNPFELYGHPDLPGSYSFTPKSIEGMSKYPKLEGKLCYGEDLRNYFSKQGWYKIHWEWLLEAYSVFPNKDQFFLPFFDKLAGTDQLRMQIEKGNSPENIIESYQEDLRHYIEMREGYLLYK